MNNTKQTKLICALIINLFLFSSLLCCATLGGNAQQIFETANIESASAGSMPSLIESTATISSESLDADSKIKSNPTTNNENSPLEQNKQILRPKQKLTELELQRQGAYAEAQIISQHERNSHLHYQHNPRKQQTRQQHQQRLLANKQLNQKIVQKASATDSSSSSETSLKDGAINLIVDSLRSGISSRSSIVKAISDNKLARSE